MAADGLFVHSVGGEYSDVLRETIQHKYPSTGVHRNPANLPELVFGASLGGPNPDFLLDGPPHVLGPDPIGGV
jgi:hypothetical protein